MSADDTVILKKDEFILRPRVAPHPQQNNRGPTFTHALLPGSPAIDAGDPSFTPPPYFDQRGLPFVRVVNGRIDIGSLEAPRQRPTPIPRSTPPR